MPFKIFVATAGALEYPRWRFILTIMIARSLRYFIEGVLAVFYGRRVLRFLRDYGLTMLGIVALLCLLGLAIYFLLKRLRTRRIVPATPAAATVAERELDASSSTTVS
jgi:membrane protein DedA with SNARE-associated domain